MLSMSFAATTDENTSTEPTDRSIPEVMMTKVIPTPSTAQTAMFWEISEKLLADRNLLPAAMLKKTTMTTSTPRIHTAWRAADALEQALRLVMVRRPPTGPPWR